MTFENKIISLKTNHHDTQKSFSIFIVTFYYCFEVLVFIHHSSFVFEEMHLLLAATANNI